MASHDPTHLATSQPAGITQPLPPPPHDLTHGANGLALGYAIIFLAMLVGLAHGRAAFTAYLKGLLLSIPALIVSGIATGVTDSLLGLHTQNALQLCVGIAISVAVGYLAGRLIAAHKGESTASQHRRGAVITESRPAVARSKDPRDPDAPVTIAGYPIPLQDETKHFKFIGTTGTGKSTAIRELLNCALTRGDRAIIADPDGGYLKTFYSAERGDVILNPFTPGAARWNMFAEIENDHDVDQLARSLIPDSGHPDLEWVGYARTLVTAVIQQTMAGNQKNDSEVYRLLESASMKELSLLLADTAAEPFLAAGKMFHCVRSIAASSLRTLKYTTRQEGDPFSVRAWVRDGAAVCNGGQGGVLFLPYKAGEIASLRSIISAWLRIAIFEAMSRPEGDQRLWFTIDELDALGEIDGLKDALARVRKFGGRCGLGLQSIAQVSNTYRGSAHTIVENCATTFVLRCSASEHGGTSEFASKLIGQREVLHTMRSRTRQPGRWRSSITTSESIKIEPAIMASEIERLPDLEGFLKVASLPDWRRVTLTPATRSPHTPAKGPVSSTSQSGLRPGFVAPDSPPPVGAKPDPAVSTSSGPTIVEPATLPTTAPRATKSQRTRKPPGRATGKASGSKMNSDSGNIQPAP